MNEREATCLAELRANGEPKLREAARRLMGKAKYREAAEIFAALAMHNDLDVDSPLRSAHSYQKDGARSDAGRWYLESA